LKAGHPSRTIVFASSDMVCGLLNDDEKWSATKREPLSLLLALFLVLRQDGSSEPFSIGSSSFLGPGKNPGS
jgi:hypothetical protein